VSILQVLSGLVESQQQAARLTQQRQQDKAVALATQEEALLHQQEIEHQRRAIVFLNARMAELEKQRFEEFVRAQQGQADAEAEAEARPSTAGEWSDSEDEGSG
jgi:hypothetical protein